MKHYSQAEQDTLALFLLGQEKYFLDIGCGDGVNMPNGSNTKLLEEQGWKGLLLDINFFYIMLAKFFRNNPTVRCNAAETNYEMLFEEYAVPKTIDYISLDVDDHSLRVLENFPFDMYSFKLMTYEHDAYTGEQKSLERKSRGKEILIERGYVLFCEDVGCDETNNKPFEDWYVNADFPNLNDYKCKLRPGMSGHEVISCLTSKR